MLLYVQGDVQVEEQLPEPARPEAATRKRRAKEPTAADLAAAAQAGTTSVTAIDLTDAKAAATAPLVAGAVAKPKNKRKGDASDKEPTALKKVTASVRRVSALAQGEPFRKKSQ